MFTRLEMNRRTEATRGQDPGRRWTRPPRGETSVGRVVRFGGLPEGGSFSSVPSGPAAYTGKRPQVSVAALRGSAPEGEGTSWRAILVQNGPRAQAKSCGASASRLVVGTDPEPGRLVSSCPPEQAA